MTLDLSSQNRIQIEQNFVINTNLDEISQITTKRC